MYSLCYQLQINFDSAQLKNLVSPGGKSLEDEVALLVSQIGENVSLRRAMCLKVADDLLVAGCTHPCTGKHESTLTGKYGSLLIYKSDSNDNRATDVAKQLCQHVIGILRLHNLFILLSFLILKIS